MAGIQLATRWAQVMPSLSLWVCPRLAFLSLQVHMAKSPQSTSGFILRQRLQSSTVFLEHQRGDKSLESRLVCASRTCQLLPEK